MKENLDIKIAPNQRSYYMNNLVMIWLNQSIKVTNAGGWDSYNRIC